MFQHPSLLCYETNNHHQLTLYANAGACVKNCPAEANYQDDTGSIYLCHHSNAVSTNYLLMEDFLINPGKIA